MTLEEKILNIHKNSANSKLKPLDTNFAKDIQTFWRDVVDPMLPDYDTMKKWHNLLIEYISFPEAVFMLRRAHDESPAYKESVPADALRRGFLTKTDAGYDFVYNDNDFATYMLAMVLDGDIIDTLKSTDLKTYLKKPNSIIRFNRSGKGGIETDRAFFKINGPQPRISKNGYTVAHIFDVNNHYYDEDLGFNNTRGDQALQSPEVQIDRGMYSDYILQETNAGKNLYYRDGYHVGPGARRFLEAHMLRFLHPLNYFCTPKDNMNGYTYCEFTDHVHAERGRHTHRRFHRISGYEHLLYYAHYKFKEKYTDIYDDFLNRIMLPKNTFDFFEKSVEDVDYYGSEIIDVEYGNPLSRSSGTATTAAKAPPISKNMIDLTKISSTYLDGFKVGKIANQVLRSIIENGSSCGKITKTDIDIFKTEKGRRTSTFMISKPLLSLSKLDDKGYLRYYDEPIVCYGETLYLYKDWNNSDKELRDNLISWIMSWINTNSGII